ncbi:binuclear zinc transcription factor [Paraphaeosphaeria minitans]|uniref:Binuclear zinc transcription factor n=1 Tax=Paraphaeosphaeria minitans TaxID=565426 RepID=A0A9P6GIM3_9PLEO|nr:binuclear zinc transcription factor [Paraphaeosphaeria minitans]
MSQSVALSATWDPTLPLQLPNFGLDALQPTSNSQDAYPTPTSNVDVVPSATREDDEPAMFPEACLPSDAVIIELVEIYFNQIYFVLPCFHRDTFIKELQSGHLQAKSPLLLYSMLAVAASYHSDPSIKARRTECYAFRGLKDGVGNERRGYYNRTEWEGRTAMEEEECRRALWILFFMDRNQSWPTGWPIAIDERKFKVDIPIADSVLQAMSPETTQGNAVNVPFTMSVDRLLSTASRAQTPLNMFHYLIIAYVLLGRSADLVHSIHDNPSSPGFAEQCEELDTYVLKLRLTVASSSPQGVKDLFSKTVMVAKTTSKTIKDASRTSIDLLLNVHIASSLYIACYLLVIQHRLEEDDSLKNDINLLELVFERMNEVFSVKEQKLAIALKRDKERNREDLFRLRERGYRGLLADCSKWGIVKDEVAKLGMTMS